MRTRTSQGSRLLGSVLALLVIASPALAQRTDAAEAAAAAPSDEAVEVEVDPRIARAQALLEQIAEREAKLGELREKLAVTEGDDANAVRRRLLTRTLENEADVNDLANLVLEMETEGLDATPFRAAVEPRLQGRGQRLRQAIQDIEKALDELRSERGSASPEEAAEIDERLAQGTALVDDFYRMLLESVDRLEGMGLDPAQERAWLTEHLPDRAEELAGRLELAVEKRDRIQASSEAKPDDVDLRSQLDAAQTRLDGVSDSLTVTVQAMRSLGLEATDYQQLLIESSGEIRGDLLDREVALRLTRRALDRAGAWVTENGPRIGMRLLVFLLILALFRVLARIASRLMRRSVTSSKLNLSQLLQNMFVSVTSKAVMVLGFLVALSQLGIQIGPMLAGLGIAGFVLGFALQDSLSNFASGMMILIYRPFDVNDVIEAGGVSGKVSAMSLVSTTILTFDNQTLVVPNNKIWGDVIRNVTAQTTRRVDLSFGISYEDDIPHAENVLEAIVKEHPKVLQDPEPVIKLHNLGDSSVDFIVRPWARSADYWDVYWDITREVKMRFDREGISIPYPQRDVHLTGPQVESGKSDA